MKWLFKACILSEIGQRFFRFPDPLENPLKNRRSLLLPNAPRHHAERAQAEADFGEEAAFGNYFSPEAGHRAGPGGPINA